MQDGIFVGNDSITGTLKYLDEGSLVDTYGAGNFIALNFLNSDFTKFSSVKVGLNPSEGTGLVEIINDPDKNGAFKITNKDEQVFEIQATDLDGVVTTCDFDLSGLVVVED